MKIACLLKGNLRPGDRTKERFNRIIASIKRAFPNDSIDFFMHLWSESDSEIDLYKDHFLEGNIVLEKNSLYYKDIKELSDLTDDRNGFGQVSHVLSISKVIKLFKLNKKDTNYDFIFITRPDLQFSEEVKDFTIDDNIIYFNQHGPYIVSGDYCFLFSLNNLHVFEGIYEFLKLDRGKTVKVSTHFWLHDYVTRICNKKVELCNIRVPVCPVRLYGANCIENWRLDQFPQIDAAVNKFLS